MLDAARKGDRERLRVGDSRGDLPAAVELFG
jgi:hypothetical protein